MIVGTGTDLVEVERIAQSIARFGDRFLRRVYTAEERRYCERKVKTAAESYAARFAAKEAAAKALGTGIARGVSWLEIEMRRLPAERPTLHMTGRAAERARAMGVTRMSISVSHTEHLAVANVILEGEA